MLDLFLKKINLKNFRNLSNQTLEFNQKLVCIVGENAQGKTNLLEAIYYIFQLKSFKNKVDFSHLLAIDGDKLEIYLGALYNTGEDHTLSLKIFPHGNELFHDQQKVLKNPCRKSIFTLVPVDSYQFFLERGKRLGWLDRELCRYQKNYAKTLQKYLHGIRQRNALLASKRGDQLQIKTLTKVLSGYCCELNLERLSFLDMIQVPFQKKFKWLFSDQLETQIGYVQTLKCSNNASETFDFWWSKINEEQIRGITKYGCHLDDISISINHLLVNQHASMGQQKMAYFSLFFSTLETLMNQDLLEHSPVVILDDISSELDSRRWKSLIKYVLDQRFQVFLTTANSTFVEALCQESKVNVYMLKDGLARLINPSKI